MDGISFVVTIEGFVEQLTEQHALIMGQQIQLAWKDFVYELYTDKTSPSELRRRDLLLALSWRPPVQKSGIRTLDPHLEECYRYLTNKAITRDLNRLVDEGLVEKTEEGFIAKTEIILGFLPARRQRKLAQDSQRRKKLREGLNRRIALLSPDQAQGL